MGRTISSSVVTKKKQTFEASVPPQKQQHIRNDAW